MSRDDRYLIAPTDAGQPAVQILPDDEHDDAATLDFHEELSAQDLELEPSSLELLYQHTVAQGEGPWLDEQLRSEFAETARLATLATRPSEQPVARKRIVPPRRSRPPEEASPTSAPPLPPTVGDVSVEWEVLRGLGRSSEVPRPLSALEAAETLESAVPTLPPVEEQSLAPLAMDPAKSNAASVASPPPPVRHRSTQLGWLTVAVLSGALGMAWINAAGRGAAAEPDASRLAARLGEQSPAAGSCDQTADEASAAPGQCSARVATLPFSVAAPGTDLGERAGQPLITPAGAIPSAQPTSLPASPGAAPVGAPVVAPADATSVTSRGSEPAMADGDPAASPLAGPSSAAEADAVAAAGSAATTGSAADEGAATSAAALPPFNAAEARSALASAALSAASSCQGTGEGTQLVPVTVTFAPSGRVTSAIVTGSVYRGTAVGGCIAQVLRATRVSPFAGDPVAVQRTVTLQ